MTIPSLLMLSEGRKQRPRKAMSMRPKEISLHMQVAKILREHCLPDWIYTHIASGEARDVRTASKLKQMGVRCGWPDFLLLGPSGRVYALELKRLRQKLTEAQEDFRVWCVAHGVPHVVAYDLAEVLRAFEDWGCLRGLRG